MVQALFLLLIAGCAVTKPCRDGGDVLVSDDEGNGNARCHQKEFEGRPQNHGKYTHFFLDGTPAVEGQFLEGKKDGIWVVYNKQHSVKAVKYYDRGVERSAPPETQKLIDEIIRQKNELPQGTNKAGRN